MWPITKFLGSNHITETAEHKVVKFCTRVGNINSNNRMTYHQQKGVVMVKWLFENFAVSRDAARRAGLSATAELRVVVSCNLSKHQFSCDVNTPWGESSLLRVGLCDADRCMDAVWQLSLVTMHEQNCRYSRMKSGWYRKCFSGGHESVCVITGPPIHTVQTDQWPD